MLFGFFIMLSWSSLAMAQYPFAQPSLADLDRNQARAKEVMKSLEDTEMKKLSKKISAHSNEVMSANPDAAIPATALSIGALFWIGHKVNLIKSDDLKLSSRVEGRGRRGSINLDSPILNGKFNFAQTEGIKFGLNKNIDEINSDAEVNYFIKDQLVSTAFRHHFTKYLALSVGMSQSGKAQPSNQNAQIQYNINF